MNATPQAPDTVSLESPQPRHVDLARTLMQDIGSGRYRIGDMLPTEAELCAQWNLSRYAVRQAILKLCELGLISRQAGIGTRVIATRPQTRYVQSMDSLSDLARYAQGTRLDVLSRSVRPASDEEAHLLHCAPGDKWLHIEGIRHEVSGADAPIALVDVYVAERYSGLKGVGKTLDTPIHTMLEQQFGIKATRVEQQIHGLLLAGEQAVALRVPDHSAGLRIVRSYYARDTMIEVTSGIHPASRFSYSMTFQLTHTSS
ncbi:GntR family transcriptional regulator [Burkholderia cenocepacia]|uniref:GntR family transcriptional regulator n=1 Tax=Burkholderia cenocepacia TaxID=95486 RepID=UPI001B982CD0|nr:GntR family transcriptional regulator [Burkholderia cenocepacia]MBR8102217.1 GntR family transcriptional regulator [Burkholderia cenocepacia]MDI9684766.1 GntR family transcriptional regulator [Burkholderia cenocepacia]HEP6433137.1 GntR family transcriptional regulator [Burkholderia cenocepacia]